MKKFLKWFLHLVICRFGIHDYEITKWSRYKDKRGKKLEEQGHHRKCKQCGKRQYLDKPKKYHPSAYVWLNSNGI